MMFSIYSGISDGIYRDIHNVAVQVQRSLHPVLWGTGIQACPTASLDPLMPTVTMRWQRRKRTGEVGGGEEKGGGGGELHLCQNLQTLSW